MSTDSRISPSLRADYLFMIEQAVKAPSGHNTQPWNSGCFQTISTSCPIFQGASPLSTPTTGNYS